MSTGHVPKNNCVSCWEAYFHTVADLVALIEELRGKGLQKFTATHGIKFVKNFRGFVARTLHNKKSAEAPTSEPTVEVVGSSIPALNERVDAVPEEEGRGA